MDIQTPAEKFLIAEVANAVKNSARPCVAINIGAGDSVVMENGIQKLTSAPFVSDRLDVFKENITHPTTRKSFVESVEDMKEVPAGEYDVALANYVLEHVPNIPAAAKEIWRVLKPGGVFVLSSPNPQAPEFVLSKYTPLWLHQFIKGPGHDHHAHETRYAYPSIKSLEEQFKQAGLETVNEKFYPFTFGYLYRFPVIRSLSRAYDALIRLFGIKRLMGNVGITFRKQK